MKNLLLACLAVAFLNSCNSGDDNPITPVLIDEPITPGTQAYIQAQMGDDAFNAMMAHGFELYLGQNPPTINGSYEVTGTKIVKTDIEGDSPIGTSVGLGFCYFGSQNNQLLRVNYDSEQQFGNPAQFTTSGVFQGEDATISGSGDYFTVVTGIDVSVGGPNTNAYEIHVISGKMTAAGIAEFRKFVFMKNNNGHTEYYFANGKSRVYADSDGLAAHYD